MNFFLIKNKEGKYLGRKAHWVKDVTQAKFYKRKSSAEKKAEYFAKNWPGFLPEVVELEC